MDRPRESAKSWLGCFLLLIVAFVIGLFVADRLSARIGGERYSERPRDRAKLRAIAATYDPLLSAIERHHEIQGFYPSSLGDLASGLERLLERPYRVGYQVSGGSFSVDVKLSWDGGLRYDSEGAQWRYDPGTGAPDWAIR